MEQNQPTPQQLQIKVLDSDLKGVYSNLMQIVHTKEEFVFDFFFNAPPQGILASRVILSPAHAKRMALALTENIKKYEEKFGQIKETEMPDEKIGFLK
jgi:hypothetical protein